MLAVNSVWTDKLDWWDKYHPYITLSPPLSLFPSVRVCWRVQDSQRFMSVTLSNSDISLTTPQTDIHTHAHELSVFHTHIVFVFHSPSPQLCGSQTYQRWDPQQAKSHTAILINTNKEGWDT